MKIAKVLSSTALILASTGLFAQSASATATATATIVPAITITNAGNMSFGNILPSTSTAGTVILATDGTRSIGTAGPTLVAGGTVSAAAFNVTSSAGLQINVTLPSGSITVGNGTTTMALSSFTSSQGASWTPAAATSTLTVGATLAVAANQATGTYTSANGTGAFTVTLAYN